MTIKQQGGVFGRNPSFNTVEANAVGVGTSTPEEEVEIRASVPTLRLTDSDNDAYTNMIHNTGTFAIDVDPTEAGGSSKFTVDIDNVRQLELNSSGNLTLNTGNLVIGTSGKGIDFSATSGTGTSELFDDYEEGTWTPEVADAQTGGNTATGTFTGYYTKIGRMVNLMFLLQNIDTTGMSASAVLYFRNFPFASSSLSGAQRALSCVHFDSGVTFDTSAIYTGEMPDSYTWGRISECVSGSGRDFLRVSDITSGSNAINLQFNYYT